MSRLVLASHNAKKLAELQRILGTHGVEVVGIGSLTDAEPPAETGDSFEQNALIKARAAARETGLAALADDSGISVDVLNGMPGVRSARWYGPDATDTDNTELLLRQLSDVPAERRGARFVCALAFVRPTANGDVAEDVAVGEVSGHLLGEPRGRHGFGYDPIFVPDGHTMTTAELSPAEKDQISHRGRALELMVPLVISDLTRE